TIQATDIGSGVCITGCPFGISTVVFRHLGTGQLRQGIFTLVSGTLNNGTFQAQVDFPQLSASGTWEAELRLFDPLGNVVNFFRADLTARGFPATLLNGSGGITGTVTRADTGAPIEGAIIDLFDGTTNAFLIGGFTTNASGFYSTGRVLPPGIIYKVRARVNPPLSFVHTFFTTKFPIGIDFFTATGVDVTANADTQNVNIAMQPGGIITGTIRDGLSGNAIGGATVFIIRVAASSFFAITTVKTGPDGTFTFRNLRDGDWLVRASAPGHITAWFSGDPNNLATDFVTATPIRIKNGQPFVITGSPLTETLLTSADMNLAAGGAVIQGRITRSDTGGPVPTGTVVELRGPTFFTRGFLTLTITDSNGMYSFSGVGPGQWIIEALGNQRDGGTAIGWYPTGSTSRSTAIPVTITGSETVTADFTVPGFSPGTSPRIISGFVRDSSGNPLSDAHIFAFDPAHLGVVRVVRVNGDGSYKLDGLRPGKYVLRADTETTYVSTASGCEPVGATFRCQHVLSAGTIVDATAANQENINLFLAATAGTLTGTVTTSTGQPIMGATVSVRNFFDNGVGSGATTRHDGSFLVRGLPPAVPGVPGSGQHKVRVVAPGFVTRHYTATATPSGGFLFNDASFVEVQSGLETSGINVALNPAPGTIIGTVRRQPVPPATIGAPLVGALVQVREATTGSTVLTVVTDANGMFMAPTLAEGIYKLRIFPLTGGFAGQWFNGQLTLQAGDTVAVTAPNTTTISDVVVSDAHGSISGRVFRSDGVIGLADAGVVIFDAATGGFVWGGGVTDTSGNHRVHGLAPTSGSYVAQARALGFARKFFAEVPNRDAATKLTVVNGADTPGTNFNLTLTSDITGTISYAGAQTGALRIGLFADAALTQRLYGLTIPSPVFPQAYGFASPPPDTQGIIPGTYFIGAFIDSNGNGVRDPSEAAGQLGGATATAVLVGENETRSGQDFTLVEGAAPGAPDLVGLITGPNAACPGQVIGGDIKLTVRNLGQTSAGQFSVGVYISADATITASDVLLVGGRETVSSLGANGTLSVPLVSSASIPGLTPTGSMFLGLLVDESNSVAETDEGNNFAAIPITIGNCTGNTPTLGSLSVSRLGQGAQNETVVLTGVNFKAGATVDFGAGITVRSVTVDSSTQITASVDVAAAAAPGLRAVTVTNPATSPAESSTLTDALEVKAAPTITCTDRIAAGSCGTLPIVGPLFRGVSLQPVNILGTGFQEHSTRSLTVSFGSPDSGVTVQEVRVFPGTAILAHVSVDQSVVGPLPVTVLNPDGGLGTGGFVDVIDAPAVGVDVGLAKSSTSTTETVPPPPPPSISGIVCDVTNAAEGPRGCRVTISGSGFGSAPRVTFSGPVLVTTFISSSDTQIVTNMPDAATDGLFTVSNTTTGLASSGFNFDITSPRGANAFFFPANTTIAENPFAGATGTLKITGTNFLSGATVDFLQPGTTVADSRIAVTGALTVSAEEISIPVSIDGAAVTGPGDVRVTNPNNRGTDTLPNAYEVRPRPVVQFRFLDPDTLADVTSTFVSSVQQVELTLNTSGQCTAKTITPTPVILEAQFTPAPTSAMTATATASPSNFPGTATNEDCEVDNATGTLLTVPRNDYSVAAVDATAAAGGADMTRTTLANVAETSPASGVYRIKLHSWDWLGHVTIQVTRADGATGSARFPLDTDGDLLPDALETNDTLHAPVVLNRFSRDQDGNGTRDDADKFRRDGLTHFEKLRAVYLKGPAPGQTGFMTDLNGNHVAERLGVGMRHLFVRARGFPKDPVMASGQCGLAVDDTKDPATWAPVTDSAPCPRFEVGPAFQNAGVKVHDVTTAFDGFTTAAPLTPTRQFPRQSFMTPANPTLDMATAVLDAINCHTSGTNCEKTWKDTGLRNMKPATLGFSTFGSADAYAVKTRVYLRALKAYINDKTYRHPDNDPKRAVHFDDGTAPHGTPMLARVDIVADANDNGVKDGGEPIDKTTDLLLGDHYVASRYDLDLSAIDTTKDGCPELPLVSDPQAIARCFPTTAEVSAGATTIPVASTAGFPTSGTALLNGRDSFTYTGLTATSFTGVQGVDATWPADTKVILKDSPQATLDQIGVVVVTHELGHAVGARHTLDTSDIMFDGLWDWLDRNFSATSGGQVQIHNKKLQ
ncbi:MAG: carboxypeptidase regulatory-like domain-containing protein, partial [Candidatus Rokubacteria bacterium]|nr:carboxypeptidase regulatory-like domain-containing protein [Candidatus Rokubacteria bacterium]